MYPKPIDHWRRWPYTPAAGALLTPIYQSTTYVMEAVGIDKGFTYSRTANPTVSALERRDLTQAME